jgi:hypothetical protein
VSAVCLQRCGQAGAPLGQAEPGPELEFAMAGRPVASLPAGPTPHRGRWVARELLRSMVDQAPCPGGSVSSIFGRPDGGPAVSAWEFQYGWGNSQANCGSDMAEIVEDASHSAPPSVRCMRPTWRWPTNWWLASPAAGWLG